MRRAFICGITILGVCASAVGQTVQSDAQTLQALLSEVRALRQDLQVSLGRTQTMQILLARLQMQEGVVARAMDHANDARQKLVDTRLHQKDLSLEVKRLEDALSTAENPQQQSDVQDRIKRVKSALEVTAGTEQQQQTTEIQAGQQLRDEQDKLSTIESQLDELIQAMNDAGRKSSANRP